MSILFFLRFALLRLWLDHKAPLVVLTAAFLAACCAFASLAMLHSQRVEVDSQLSGLLSQKRPAPGQLARQAAEPDLPVFSAEKIVSDFGAIATDAGLPFDEVTYALESDNQQPYLRYRISVTVKSGYPQVRNFVAALAADVPHATLDAIRCGRENAAAPLVQCELSFSAFFRRDNHG